MDPTYIPGFRSQVNADRLIKLDMPELELELPEGQPQRVEIYDETTAQWDAASTERWAVDGRVSLRFDNNDEESVWVDLTKCRYRWLAGPVALSGPALEAGGEETPRGADD